MSIASRIDHKNWMAKVKPATKFYYHLSDHTNVIEVDRADVRPTHADGKDKWDYVYVKRGKGEMLVCTFPDRESCIKYCEGFLTLQAYEYKERHTKKVAQLQKLWRNVREGGA